MIQLRDYIISFRWFDTLGLNSKIRRSEPYCLISARTKNSVCKMYIIQCMIDGSVGSIVTMMLTILDAQSVTMSKAWFHRPLSSNDWYASDITRSRVTNTRQFFLDCLHEWMSESINDLISTQIVMGRTVCAIPLFVHVQVVNAYDVQLRICAMLTPTAAIVVCVSVSFE